MSQLAPRKHYADRCDTEVTGFLVLKSSKNSYGTFFL